MRSKLGLDQSMVDRARPSARKVAEEGLSVRQTEALVTRLQRGQRARKSAGDGVDYVREAEKRLSDALGRGVKLSGGKKGRISLEFYSADDREALMDALLRMEKPWQNNGSKRKH